MKKMRLVLASLLTALVITSCSKQVDHSFVSLTEAESIIPGSWRVDYYNGTVADQYTEFTFNFMDDGSMIANDGAKQYDGTWTVAISMDGTYDEEIQINIAGSPEVEALSGKWLVTEMNEARMNLLDDTDAEEIFFLRN